MIPNWSAERRRAVHKQLEKRGIRDPRVLAAMNEVPREEFLPVESRVLAYQDAAIGIGYGQTISQPYMTALMAQNLELRGEERVLEVGSGCGYAAAVLGLLAREVVTVEIVPELAAMARENLRRTGRDHNVQVVLGDGGWGHFANAPYAGISVAAAAPEIPPALLDQLDEGGLLAIPVGSRDDQEFRIVRRRGDRFETRVATMCRFVPLRGGEGWN